MKRLFFLIVLNFILKLAFSQPISLHPDNPHYFIFKERPTVLITSAEHYGAVLNLDFDYRTYLKTLHNEGMNYTRIFTGSYLEIPGSFGIQTNTLAPKTGRFIALWQRVSEPGLFKGENKFDLNTWNENYFERLVDFVKTAESYGIIVEVTLFCSTYEDRIWVRNPFNPGNNVNLSGELDRKKSNTLLNGQLFEYQKKMVQKIVAVLNGFDNVFYEIQNEPWADDPQPVMRTLKTLDPKDINMKWVKWADEASPASLEWQKMIAKTIKETETFLLKKHLIAQNYTNFKHSLSSVDPNVDLLNFHYAWPDAVWLNYAWDKPICFDESGFDGSSDTTYLRQAWQFMFAGGAVFNNLDYSFACDYETGTLKNQAPGGGSANLRKMLAVLGHFFNGIDFIQMSPDFNIVHQAPGMEHQALSAKGKQYAIFLNGVPGNWIKVNLPANKFEVEFISPFSGKTLDKLILTGKGGKPTEIKLPDFKQMLAVKIFVTERLKSGTAEGDQQNTD